MPRLSIDDLNSIVTKRGYAVASVSAKADNSGLAPVLERSARPRALGARKAKGANPAKFFISVKDFRHRLLDEDNLCEKYHVDCLRYAGLIPGDAPGQAQIKVSQEKIGREESPRVEIEIDILPTT